MCILLADTAFVTVCTCYM